VNNAAHSAFAADVSVDGNRSTRPRFSWTMGALGLASVLLAPIAFWQFDVAGLGFLAAFAAVIAAACWAANLTAARFARADHMVAGVLLASGVRMALPLVVALWIIVFGGRFAPAPSALLLVPLYLSVLLMDTIYHVRHPANQAGLDCPLLPPVGSTPRRQG
jgi:hypothetical protein